MAGISDDQLREMAQHRGLKLVKSRRRKPGVGDFGKFGLTDAAGKALLGIDEEGLTASAAEVEHYLRASEQSTWKQSADTTPDRPAASTKARVPEPTDEDAPVPRRSGKATATARAAARAAGSEREADTRQSERKTRPKPALRLVSNAEPESLAAPEPVPEPVLRVRAATTADAEALSALLSQLGAVSVDRAEVADNLAKARKAKAGTIVAELGEIVGCCGWAIIPTVHRGAMGRLSVLVVDHAHRRRGIGTQLLAAAEQALANAGCIQVEAMSDIAIANSHNFFRSLKFEQASYRFVRAIGVEAQRERVPRRKD